LIDLPAGYELGPPTLGDLDAAAEVLVADDLDDAGEVVLDAGFLRDEWSRTGFDLATDAWVVRDDLGTIVAYGQVMREEPNVVASWGLVLPAHRGRGVGSSLLDRIEERASELLAGTTSPRFRHAVNAGDTAAASMLEARGLRTIRHFWHMGVDLEGPFEPGAMPPGIDIGGIEPVEDLPVVQAVLDEAFADDRTYHAVPFDRWLEEETNTPSYDPTLWLLARAGGLPVGALAAIDAGDRGWVVWIGVLAAARGRGVAAAMLRRSFATFVGRGRGRVMVNVDAENPTGATTLYERVGMRVVKRWDQWERSSIGST
jgi:mycothiol synthase